MIKVVPFIETIGSEKFHEFLTRPFQFELLYSDNQQILFDGWRSKDMATWYKYTNDDNFILEVYAETYVIKTEMNVQSKTYTLPHPRTINDFINDMNRFGIQLYWNNWVNENLEPKDFLHKDKIFDYYFNLLDTLNKSFELQ